jgi:multidrug efflux pump subunit AcrB
VPINYNLAFIQTDNVTGMDADILIALKEHHHPSAEYMKRIRATLEVDQPGASFYFQPADLIGQVLNFGLSAAVDVQVEHPNLETAAAMAHKLTDLIRTIPGAVDVHIIQQIDYPSLEINVDRERAARIGLTQRDVAQHLLISLSSSSLVSPAFFLNPTNNVNYFVVVKTPLDRLRTVPSLLSTPLTPPSASAILPPGLTPPPSTQPAPPTNTIGNIAALNPTVSPSQITHYTVQRVIDVAVGIEGRDLGSVADEVQKKINSLGQLPKGMRIAIRGQSETMNTSFRSLGLGLILAVILVYCLMVVLFQSFIDPLLIMIAVPGAFAGILWMLALTHTTLNVESLMGAIMAVGIAVSNSILMVSFANEVRVAQHGHEAIQDPVEAALAAGKTRLRPVLMTALAMIIGMVPMALALGEGGEQNAPLGRAVIGGLVMATVTTLFVVPVAYASLRKKPPTKHLLDERFAREKAGAPPLPLGEEPHEEPAVPPEEKS